MTLQDAEASLPRWAYVLLAALAASIGLASSWITAKFFVLGLERLEPDAMAKDLLIAAGVLMIATELMAFGVAALLPIAQLRAMRHKLLACGFLLLAFEATTIYATQVTLLQTSEAGATAIATRIQNLTVSIDQRRLAAKTLRDNGAKQSESANAWTRTLGAGALRDALKVEQAIEPLASELAQLQSSVRPTMSTILGSTGMLIYSVARALLISVMGLVMFATAGALLRESFRGRGMRMLPPRVPLSGASQDRALGATSYRLPALQAPTYKIAQLLGSTPTPTALTSATQQASHEQPHVPESPAGSVQVSHGGSRPTALEPCVVQGLPIRQAVSAAKGWCDKIPSTWALLGDTMRRQARGSLPNPALRPAHQSQARIG